MLLYFYLFFSNKIFQIIEFRRTKDKYFYATNDDKSRFKKWQKEYINDLIKNNFIKIEDAIKENKDLIILPETQLPFELK